MIRGGVLPRPPATVQGPVNLVQIFINLGLSCSLCCRPAAESVHQVQPASVGLVCVPMMQLQAFSGQNRQQQTGVCLQVRAAWAHVACHQLPGMHRPPEHPPAVRVTLRKGSRR